MVLIQLKMPPERLAGIIESVERDLATTPPPADSEALKITLDWLRYRHSLWTQRRRTKSVV